MGPGALIRKVTVLCKDQPIDLDITSKELTYSSDLPLMSNYLSVARQVGQEEQRGWGGGARPPA